MRCVISSKERGLWLVWAEALMAHIRRSTVDIKIAPQRRVPRRSNPIIFQTNPPAEGRLRRRYGACGVAGIGVFVGAAIPKNITSESPPVFETQRLPLGSTLSA